MVAKRNLEALLGERILWRQGRWVMQPSVGRASMTEDKSQQAADAAVVQIHERMRHAQSSFGKKQASRTTPSPTYRADRYTADSAEV